MAEPNATLTAGQGTPAAAEELAPGARVGRYVVEARLGGGGAGTVYAARDEELGREVAPKILGIDSLVQHGRALASMAEAQRQKGDAAGGEATAKQALQACGLGRGHPAFAALARLTLARLRKEDGHAMAAVGIDALERSPPGYRRFLEAARREFP